VTQTIPVSQYAILRRVNRALAHENCKLVTARGRAIDNVGKFYILNTRKNLIVEARVDLTKLATKLESLAPYERMVED
jgi:hypothetical protein